jgi:phage terminase large subunit-like protein
MLKLQPAMRHKYEEFLEEGTLVVMDGSILNMRDVYDDLIEFIDRMSYDVQALGYDPYNAREFIEAWEIDNGPFGIEKVKQGAKTESVPLGEIKKLAEDGLLIFDEKLMQFAMGNCIALEDTNGNRKLFKRRREEKIDNVAALLDAFVAYKLNKDLF